MGNLDHSFVQFCNDTCRSMPDGNHREVAYSYAIVCITVDLCFNLSNHEYFEMSSMLQIVTLID